MAKEKVKSRRSLAGLADRSHMWTPFDLTMTFNIPGSPLCGSRPMNPAIVRQFMEIRAATDPAYKRMQADGRGPEAAKPRDLDTMAKDAIERLPRDDELPADAARDVMVGFDRPKDSEGDARPYLIHCGNLRAHMKTQIEAMLPGMKATLGEHMPTALKDRAADHMYVTAVGPDGSISSHATVLGTDGQPFAGTPEYRDQTMSVPNGFGGKMSCMKVVQQIWPCELRFRLAWMDDGWAEDIDATPMQMLTMMLNRGCVTGFNGDRTLGYGRYNWRLKQVIGGKTAVGGPGEIVKMQATEAPADDGDVT